MQHHLYLGQEDTKPIQHIILSFSFYPESFLPNEPFLALLPLVDTKKAIISSSNHTLQFTLAWTPDLTFLKSISEKNDPGKLLVTEVLELSFYLVFCL